jgi:hypothetical protein
VLVIPTQVATYLTNSKKRKKIYELNCHFQDSWVVKLLWVESIVGVKGKTIEVKCKVCNVIDGRNRLLVANSNSLWKHVSHMKATIASAGVVTGDIYS